MKVPTLPNPWIAAVVFFGGRFSFFNRASATVATPRPVASSRPSAPCSSTGLPVTQAGLKPWYFWYWLMIQAITWAFVPMSGAGMSLSGPITSWIASTKPRVTRSSSEGDSVFTSTAMPPFAPP